MTAAYQTGFSEGNRHSFITKRERAELLRGLGFDLSTAVGSRAMKDFQRGFAAGCKQQQEFRRLQVTGLLGEGPIWHVTAEHTSGKSVDHCCTTGVFSDPTDGFEVLVTADTAVEAEEKALAELRKTVDNAPVCKCRRREQAGSNLWWESVALSAQQISRREAGEFHPCTVAR